ncbi:MAG: insulinase family protein [Tindallia sp. MSAO_Bac2]|nr:MAG: insulinase family protein [Tindallia sp. MSAO_Bac2]
MVEKHELKNGLRIVTEKIPHVKSVAVGIWVKSGVIHETKEQNGISHFIEHMLFKGTEKRSARQLAEDVDLVGGHINAYTSREYTCYYIKVLDEHIELAIDILTDMFFHSEFDPEEIEKEKSVIMEEISMYDDSPEDLAHDILIESMLSGSALGYPILGTMESVTAMSQHKLKKYMNEVYRPDNTVISLAGNFNEKETIELLKSRFEDWKTVSDHQENCSQIIKLRYDDWYRYKDIEQIHLNLGYQGAPLGTEDMYDLLLVNNILGGSMSSRLFQTIREDKGLAYSIYSYMQNYSKVGMLSIYCSLNPDQLDAAYHLINLEMTKLRNYGLTSDEFIKAKNQLKGSFILGMESTSGRMATMGKSLLMLDRIDTQDTILSKINSISYDRIMETIHNYFHNEKKSSVVVGKNHGPLN